MGILYTPFSIVAKIVGKKAGRAAFANLWAQFGDGERPPKPNAGRRSYPSVFLTAAFEAAVLAGAGAVMDQMFSRGFKHLFGAWPGKLDEPEARPDAEPQPLDSIS